MYMALLMDAAASAPRTSGYFNYRATNRRLASDFAGLRLISLENEVATFTNQLEYLLDMAELRIRDAAMRGWGKQGGEESLEHHLETVTNEYLVEMAALMGRFFEGDRAMKYLKVFFIFIIEYTSRINNDNNKISLPLDVRVSPASRSSFSPL
jgi:hypothetical protein